MNSECVSFQVASICKSFAALSTHVGSFFGVGTFMGSQGTPLLKSFRACLAFEWFFISVDEFMTFKVTSCREGLVADFTNVSSLLGMCSDVCLQGATLRKGSVADFTDVRLFVQVDPLMNA